MLVSTRALRPLFVVVGLGACHPGAREPDAVDAALTSAPVAAPSVAKPAPSSVPQRAPGEVVVHRIVQEDHRRAVRLQQNDRIVLPTDPTFDWRVDFENKAAFTRATVVDAGAEAYQVTGTGPLRIMVFGDPKCMRNDASCTISRRRWDITLDVR